MDHSSLEARVDYVLRSIENAGFPTPESFMSSYYTAVFRDRSTVQKAQEASRSRGLPMMLDELRLQSDDWSVWQSRPYTDSIVRSAALMIADEFDRLTKKRYHCEKELQRGLAPGQQVQLPATPAESKAAMEQLNMAAAELKKTLRNEVGHSLCQAMNRCEFQADNVFGPRIVVCRDGFDFTLLFEQSILSIGPSAIALIASVGWIVNLLQQDVKTKPDAKWRFRVVKQCRTLWMRQDNSVIAAVFTAGLVSKAAMLGAEIMEKRRILKSPYSLYPPEAIGGVLNRSVFWWINALLLRGSSAKLGQEDLFNLDVELTTKHIEPKFRRIWAASSNQLSHSLLFAILKNFWFKILTVVFFRLCLIGFKFSQPLLIHRAVSLLEEPDTQEKRSIGRSLIGATSLIYIGIALMTGMFRHNVYRLMTMVRSAIVGLIYRTTLSLDAKKASNSAALTLMSTDLESIATGFEVFDSLWADPIEIGIAIYILYSQIGLAFVAPIIASLIFICIPIALRGVSASAQKDWLKSIERRVAIIASILSNMKGVKMTGLSDLVGDRLQTFRVHELRVASKFQAMLAVSVLIGSMSQVVIPVITLITYVFLVQAEGSSLTSAKAFTALSLVSLLAYPIQNMAKAIPQLAAGVGCFQRIQEYVLNGEKAIIEPDEVVSAAIACENKGQDSEHGSSADASEKQALLTLKDASFTIGTTNEPILRNISISIFTKTWTIIIGPVGSGKSVLLLALLDELHLKAGSIDRAATLRGGIGYCAQDAWLPNLSIRDIICADDIGNIDETWYNTVVEACVLRSDLDELPSGDRTVIGSNGVSLSGGQKQRKYDGGDESKYSTPSNDSLTAGSSPSSLQTDNFADISSNESDIVRQTGDFRLYAYYFRALGWVNTIGMALAILTYSVFQKFPTVWVQWWTAAEADSPGRQTDMYAGVYGAFCGICLVCFTTCIFLLFRYGIPRSSIALHAMLLKATFNAPYWFFVSTDTGDLINRFSQDMSLVCMQLPAAFVDTMFNAGVCIMGGILITMASKWSLIIYPALIVILYTLQRFYLYTSRQMRLLDLEAKAPLYSYFLETLQGIITIKAFAWQVSAEEHNSRLLDSSQRPFYLMYSIQRWLNLVLDFLVAGVATIVVTLATQLKDSSSGALGVALLNILTFSQDLTSLIRTWTDLETSLGAIARVKSFESNTPSEHTLLEKTDPPEQWPSQGNIELQQASVSYKCAIPFFCVGNNLTLYRSGGELVLKAISLKIPARSKVGICGRTGSGKSTFILTLLRLAEIESGDVFIDGLSIRSIPRNTLRQGLIVVPQDPLLLPGTIRFNADPISKHQDDAILRMIDEVGLLDIVKSADGELDADIDSLSLSKGQQQLFCLVRAMLGSSRIVVLDEMTSSVDAVTEEKMMSLSIVVMGSLEAYPVGLLDLKIRPLPHTDSRTDEEIVHAILNPPPVTTEEIVWAFWDKGYDAMAPWQNRNVLGWARILGPSWSVRVLDLIRGSPANIFNFLDGADLPKHLNKGPKTGRYAGVICWAALKSPKSKFQVAVASGDPTLKSGTAENFFIAGRKGNGFIKRWMMILLETWTGRINNKGVHAHPLFHHLVRDGNITHVFKGATGDKLDYFQAYLAGPSYCKNRVLLIDYKEFATGAMLTNDSGPKQMQLFNTRYDQNQDSEEYKEAKEFLTNILNNAAMLKQYHWRDHDVPTLADLWDQPKNHELDAEPNTLGEYLRYISSHYTQDRTITGLKFPPIREKVLVAGVLETFEN
ncbi:hypothetical protein DV737_g3391, partial [Chaetothyriales sp. CBS 132003]